ncbi:MAG: hypothetical protein IT395_06600 [Candidatus Omnitrophica bacterium]|nr:hypothetical protein [Candidatus Omnitrophota bacterium]
MTRFPLLILLFLAFLTSGCAKVSHLQELLCLKAYSEEKESQAVLVQKQNEHFERLLQAVKHGEIGKYPDQKSVWKNFGEPVFKTKVVVAETSYQVWLYRYTTKLFGSSKVYLYFDYSGKLKIYDHSPGGTMTPVIEVAHVKK